MSRKFYIILAILTVGAALAMVCLYMTLGKGYVTEIPDSEEFPVRGVDISYHNGTVDFDKLREGGNEFVMMKASEGSTFKDPAFYSNYLKARRAGLKVGAYHFFRFDSPGVMQGINFVNSLRGRPLDFPAIIDIEEWTNPITHSTEKVVSELRLLISHLEEADYQVMLYTNKDGYDRFIHGRFDHYPLWLCSFTRPAENVGWTFRQYTHRGEAPGVEGHVDLNVYSGSRSEWDSLFATARP